MALPVVPLFAHTRTLTEDEATTVREITDKFQDFSQWLYIRLPKGSLGLDEALKNMAQAKMWANWAVAHEGLKQFSLSVTDNMEDADPENDEDLV